MVLLQQTRGVPLELTASPPDTSGISAAGAQG
jgi:hypothetical protein